MLPDCPCADRVALYQEGHQQEGHDGTRPEAAARPARRRRQISAAITGSFPLPRSQVVSKMWDHIRQNNLQNSQNKREILGSRQELKKIFGAKIGSHVRNEQASVEPPEVEFRKDLREGGDPPRRVTLLWTRRTRKRLPSPSTVRRGIPQSPALKVQMIQMSDEFLTVALLDPRGHRLKSDGPKTFPVPNFIEAGVQREPLEQFPSRREVSRASPRCCTESPPRSPMRHHVLHLR